MAEDAPPPRKRISSTPCCVMSEISMPILPKLPDTSDNQLANSPNPSRMACQLLSGAAKPNCAARAAPSEPSPTGPPHCTLNTRVESSSSRSRWRAKGMRQVARRSATVISSAACIRVRPIKAAAPCVCVNCARSSCKAINLCRKIGKISFKDKTRAVSITSWLVSP